MENTSWLKPSEQLPEAGQAIEVKYTVNGNEYVSHTIYRPEKELVPIWVEHEVIGWRLLKEKKHNEHKRIIINRFETFKQEILKRAKEAEACAEQYRRVLADLIDFDGFGTSSHSFHEDGRFYDAVDALVITEVLHKSVGQRNDRLHAIYEEQRKEQERKEKERRKQCGLTREQFSKLPAEEIEKLKQQMERENENVNVAENSALNTADVSSSFYSDGNDYSHLEVNSEQFPEHEECVMCGSTSVTITDDKDICHNCGYVYE